MRSANMTKEKAKAWLDKQLKKYGNTYFFPTKEQAKLNRYIEKFGNTYFWNRQECMMKKMTEIKREFWLITNAESLEEAQSDFIGYANIDTTVNINNTTLCMLESLICASKEFDLTTNRLFNIIEFNYDIPKDVSDWYAVKIA